MMMHEIYISQDVVLAISEADWDAGEIARMEGYLLSEYLGAGARHGQLLVNIQNEGIDILCWLPPDYVSYELRKKRDTKAWRVRNEDTGEVKFIHGQRSGDGIFLLPSWLKERLHEVSAENVREAYLIRKAEELEKRRKQEELERMRRDAHAQLVITRKMKAEKDAKKRKNRRWKREDTFKDSLLDFLR